MAFIVSLNYGIVTLLAVNLLALVSDITLTWTSPVFPKLLSNDTSENPLGRPITHSEESWIGSFVTLGAIFGPVISGFTADLFGRKNVLLALGIPHLISFITLAFAKSVELYYFARFISGLSLGASYTLLPIYIGEIAEDYNRGMYLSVMNVFTTVGNLVSYIVGPFVSIFWFNIIIAFIPIAFLVVFFTIAPESPYHLVAKNKMNNAKKALMKLRTASVKDVETELEKIRCSVESDRKGNLKDLVNTKSERKAITISICLVAFQQLSGVNVVTFYTEFIFEKSGGNFSPEIGAIVVGIVQFLSSFIAPVLADKKGRRILFMISALGMSISLAGLGLYFYLKEQTSIDVSTLYWLPILSLGSYIILFNVGFGPLPSCIIGEVFSTNTKSIAACVTTIVCWVCGFLTIKFFTTLRLVIGHSGSFWTFSCISVIAFFFVLFFVPETKGKSFQEIKAILSS